MQDYQLLSSSSSAAAAMLNPMLDEGLAKPPPSLTILRYKQCRCIDKGCNTINIKPNHPSSPIHVMMRPQERVSEYSDNKNFVIRAESNCVGSIAKVPRQIKRSWTRFNMISFIAKLKEERRGFAQTPLELWKWGCVTPGCFVSQCNGTFRYARYNSTHDTHCQCQLEMFAILYVKPLLDEALFHVMSVSFFV